MPNPAEWETEATTPRSGPFAGRVRGGPRVCTIYCYIACFRGVAFADGTRGRTSSSIIGSLLCNKPRKATPWVRLYVPTGRPDVGKVCITKLSRVVWEL